MALPCASAKRSRVPSEVFDVCWNAGRRLSPRDGVIIRELNEIMFLRYHAGQNDYLPFFFFEGLITKFGNNYRNRFFSLRAYF